MFLLASIFLDVQIPIPNDVDIHNSNVIREYVINHERIRFLSIVMHLFRS